MILPREGCVVMSGMNEEIMRSSPPFLDGLCLGRTDEPYRGVVMTVPDGGDA